MVLHEYVNVYESFYISADTYGYVWSPWLSTYADKSGVYGQPHSRPVDLLLEVFLPPQLSPTLQPGRCCEDFTFNTTLRECTAGLLAIEDSVNRCLVGAL